MALDMKRALEDPEYRKTLTTEELASLPDGMREISEKELGNVAGGQTVGDKQHKGQI